MMLIPHLLKLTEDDGGKFLLVLVNTDSLGQIAHQYGVTSVPTVKFPQWPSGAHHSRRGIGCRLPTSIAAFYRQRSQDGACARSGDATPWRPRFPPGYRAMRLGELVRDAGQRASADAALSALTGECFRVMLMPCKIIVWCVGWAELSEAQHSPAMQ